LLNLKYIPEKTIQELYLKTPTVKGLSETIYTNSTQTVKIDASEKNMNLFHYLKTFVNSFNTYINVDNLKEFTYSQLYETLLVLHMGNKNEMLKNINNIDLVNSKNDVNKMFNIIVKYLLKEIQNNKLNLVSNVIDQVINDVSTINEFLKIFPTKCYVDIKRFISITYGLNDDYENFLNYINKICIIINPDLQIGMNSTELLLNNKFLLHEKISDVLNLRSKDSVNNTWKDLLNMLFASL
jgi:hypothetical protein